jgi:hypothetical protein
MDTGIAAHLLIQEWWSWMNKKYAFLEKWEKRTSKKYEDEERILLTNSDWEKILRLHDEITRQSLFDHKGKYEKEKEVIHWDLKCTLDRIDVENWIIRDLKFIADVSKFERDYFSPLWYNYQLQACFYSYVCSLVYFKPFRFLFDVVSHWWEYCCFEYDITDQWLQEVVQWIKSLRECKDFKWKEYRDQCLNCSMYKHCSKTAVQINPIKIWESFQKT